MPGNVVDVKVRGDSAQAERSIDRVRGSVKKLGKDVLSSKLGLAALAAGAGFAFVSTIKAAADAEESTSKFNVTFGSNAEMVKKRLEAFADTVGRSRDELTTMSADSGAVIKALGLEANVAADLSAKMSELAVDVASFMNANDTDVLNAFTRALTGEREALKTYGIVIQEAEVQQRILAQGLVKSTKEVTSQMKAMATYELLLERTSDAQGDAERTSASFTNQMKKLKGQIHDLQVELGTGLLPVLTAILKTLNGIIDAAKTLGPIFRQQRDLVAGGIESIRYFGGPVANTQRPFVQDLQGLTSRNVTISFSGTILGDETQARALARQIQKIIREEDRLGGALA